MNSRRTRTWLLGLSILFWIVGCSTWKYLGGHAYYISTAQVSLAAFTLVHNNGKVVYQWLSAFAVFVSGNVVVDELLLTPWELNITEYVIATIALIYYLTKYVPTIKHTTRRWLKKLTTRR